MFEEISFGQIKPCIRTLGTVYTVKSFAPLLFKSYSQRLYYIKDGSCTFVVDGVSYKMKKHSLILIRNGVPYKLIPGKTDVRSLTISFSYSSDKPEWSYRPDTARVDNFNEDSPRERVVFTDLEYLNGTICLADMHCIKYYIAECLSEFRLQKPYYRENCSYLIMMILNMVRRNYELHENSVSYKVENYVDAVIEFIHDRHNHKLSNDAIGKRFNLHPNYINKLIRERTGYSLHQYVNIVRIENAIKLFESTEMTISEVANSVGFVDTCYFSTYFKQITGKSPSYYYNK